MEDSLLPMSLTNLLVGPPPIPDPMIAMAPPRQEWEQEREDGDIYRGLDPRTPRPSSQHSGPTSLSSSSSSSSSSSGGLRFSNIASTIEHTIGRWARGRGLRRRGTESDGSSSGSSSSSTSSSGSSAASNRGRKSKRSPASILSHTTSLTTRRQERAALRQSPREFILLLPPQSSISIPSTTSDESGSGQRELKTMSLKLVLAQLALAMKKNAKIQQRSLKSTNGDTPMTELPSIQELPPPPTERRRRPRVPRVLFDLPPGAGEKSLSPGSTLANMKKGKARARDVPRQFFWQGRDGKTESPQVEIGRSEQSAWWLDVASPTWDDMRAIGKLLQLHPLTLEDILQKESREKFEVFPRLGYYFVVFRAIEMPNPDDRRINEDEDSDDELSHVHEAVEVLEATNLYLVVFKEGICTFHFEDISAHTNTVRRKLLQFQETIQMTSDWIAHGIMDSIVDSFFPVLKVIQKEVEEVEDLVSGIDTQWGKDMYSPTGSFEGSSPTEIVISAESDHLSEKLFQEKEKSTPTRRFVPQWKHYVQIILFPISGIVSIFRREHKPKPRKQLSTRLKRLVKMTATRRLVTTLSRLLSSKAEVIAQIRKRLIGQGEVSIYFGDVQDHIISLLQSSAHYERMLSHSHPAYLSHLRFLLSEAKSGMDNALLWLTLIGVLVLSSQCVSSLAGINVHVPKSSPHFTAFGVMLSISVLAGTGIASLAFYWWKKSKGGRGKLEEVKSVD